MYWAFTSFTDGSRKASVFLMMASRDRLAESEGQLGMTRFFAFLKKIKKCDNGVYRGVSYRGVSSLRVQGMQADVGFRHTDASASQHLQLAPRPRLASASDRRDTFVLLLLLLFQYRLRALGLGACAQLPMLLGQRS